MSFPNYPAKHTEDALFTPDDYLPYLRSVGEVSSAPPPEGVILCYQKSLWTDICAKHTDNSSEGARPGFGNLRIVRETHGRIGVVGGFGFGAPSTCFLLEQLIASGVGRFISIGTAGSLQKDLGIGDLIVCNKAIRDEGTSHHYAAPSKYAEAGREITARLISVLENGGIPYRSGASWTTDAPYRETIAEARIYQQEGILSVEMEASALFTVAKYRDVELGAMFTISDSLADLKWHPATRSAEVRNGLKTLYEIALQSLMTECTK